MITALLIGAGALWLISRKHNGVSGIGATKRPKRRIWREIEEAQRAGIDLTNPNGWEGNKGKLDRIMFLNDAEPRASKSDKPTYQRYFGQLSRAYKAIAGTNLPYDESVVRNENDDVILIYRDYHMEQLPSKAAEFIYTEFYSTSGDADNAYWITIADIATGRAKFVWSSSKQHRGAEQLIFGHSVPSERKQRISYLASPAKGGVYPEPYAERMNADVFDGKADDTVLLDGVLEAIRTVTSVKQAQEMCIEQYMKAYQVQEPLLYQDVPF